MLPISRVRIAALCMIGLIAFSRLTTSHWWRQWQGLILLVLAALGVTGIYTALGASAAGTTSALIYFRAFTSPLFAVFVGLNLGRSWSFKTIGSILAGSPCFGVLGKRRRLWRVVPWEAL